MATRQYVKDPADVLDYRFDWSQWLTVGESIQTSTVSADTGITIDSSSNTTDSVTVWLSGGSLGGNYRVSSKIETTMARTVERSIAIKVEER